MIDKKIKALVIDDEPLARKYIRRLLADSPDIEVIGECGNGNSALADILEKKPDLIFLDIQMPEMDGFQVLANIGEEQIPQIVFTTAFEQYAIRAFEIHALDYLLKPFDQPRFERAVRRVRERFENRRQREDNRRQVSALLEDVREKEDFLSRIMIKANGRIVFLKTSEIDWIEADGKYVHLHTGKTSRLVRQTLGGMEEQLDSKKFVRIHRSAIVNIDRIKELQPLFSGDHTIVLETGRQLTLSRSYKGKLFERLGNPL